jgi:photosystem II stability/assembly factor-like uncharacterized protein
MSNIRSSIILAGILTFSIPALGQHIAWLPANVVQHIPARHYDYTALDALGEIVTAAASVYDTVSRRHVLLFVRSTDGGITWIEQDPGLSHKTQTIYKIAALQMIDAKHIIAVSDSGFVIRTADAGEHWTSLLLSRTSYPSSVCFVDTNVGMIAARGDTAAYTTTDGGQTWIAHYIPMSGWAIRGKTDDHSHFTLFSYGYGSIYRTNDAWMTFDTSPPIAPQTDLEHLPIDARLEREDNLVAFGARLQGDPVSFFPYMVRSRDSGYSWSTVDLPVNSLSRIEYVTSTARDTVLAVGDGSPEYLLSFDGGASWIRDTLLTLTPFAYYTGDFVHLTASGKPLGLFRGSHFDQGSGLFVGTWQSASVDRFERIVYNTHFHPNPATTHISVESVDYSQPILIFDILGHEVLRGKLDGSGHAQFDVSQLPRGVYSVILKHNGIPLPIGKVAVVGR